VYAVRAVLSDPEGDVSNDGTLGIGCYEPGICSSTVLYRTLGTRMAGSRESDMDGGAK
jgi:hypothetical protein